MRVRTLVLAWGAATFLTACGSSPDLGTGARSAEPALAAEFDSGSVTLEELDTQLGLEVEQLQERLYTLRRDALRPLVTQRLVEAEARHRGMSVEQLLEVEVRQRVPEPEPGELEAFYREYPERFEQDSKAIALAKIQDAMFKARATQRRTQFERELWQRAGVRLHLEPPRQDVPIPEDAPTLGPDDASVTIVEFTDYQCPYCRAAQQTVDAVMERYAGKLRLVSRDLPLDMHARARHGARAARCAGEQGRFWEYHRDLLLEPDALSDAQLLGRAERLGLEQAAFEACLASDRHAPAIERAAEDAAHLGVQATPTFFVNGRRLSGARSFEAFAAVIDDELQRAGGG